MLKRLREDITKRRDEQHIAHEMLDVFVQVASILSPCYKSMRHMKYFRLYKYRDLEAIFIVANLAQSLHPEIFNELSIKPDSGPPRKKVKVHKLLFGALPTDSTNELSGGYISMRSRIEVEYASYMQISPERIGEKSGNPLKFWKQEHAARRHPILCASSKFVYCTPASSTPFERVFSAAGLIRNKLRCKLDPNMTDSILRVGHYLQNHSCSDPTICSVQ